MNHTFTEILESLRCECHNCTQARHAQTIQGQMEAAGFQKAAPNVTSTSRQARRDQAIRREVRAIAAFAEQCGGCGCKENLEKILAILDHPVKS